MQVLVEVIGGVVLVALILRGGFGFATDFGWIKKEGSNNG